MSAFLVDEDLPVSLARALRAAGRTARHLREIGMRGASDADVIARARERQEVLITADLDFANIVAYPLGTHAGIVAVRLPTDIPVAERVARVVHAVGDLEDRELAGSLVVVERERVRLRSATAEVD